MKARDQEYIFILGRNPRISLLELTSILKYRKQKFSIIQKTSRYVILKLQENFTPPNQLKDETGSILKIGENIGKFLISNDVNSSYQISQLLNKFPLDYIDHNFNWGISLYDYDPQLKSLFTKLRDQSKIRLKNLKVKGSFTWPQKGRKYPFEKRYKIPLMPDDIIRKRLLENGFEIILTISNNKCNLWKTIGVLQLHRFNERDFNRPYQRPTFSIAPSLARTMINLVQSNKSDPILDPFCGIGTILQEALLSGFRIKGIDKDIKCVTHTIKNLIWLSKRYNLSYSENIFRNEIIEGDATLLEDYFDKESIHSIVTEPELGPPLKSIPSKREAEIIIVQIRRLYEQFLKSAYKILVKNGRIILTIPLIRVKKGGFISFQDEKKLIEQIKLKIISGPHLIRPGRKNEFYSKKRMIERELYILGK